MKMKSSLTTALGALAVLLLLFTGGCATTTAQSPTLAQPTGAHSKAVPQDAALRITTQEVMALFAKEFGDAPLIEETLKKNSSFLLVDTRPAVRFNEGTVPGSISIPTPMLEKNLAKLPRDRTIIFFCGGPTCPLSPEAAEIAGKNGFTNIKVWYEGEPGWSKAGNYLITTTPQVKRMVENSEKENFVLIDARPHRVHQQEFISGSLSLPWVLFNKKQGQLPADKDTPLIFYCGGHHCDLSHNLAKAALALGYTRVSVYSAGIPEWKQQGLPLWGNEASGVVAAPKADTGALPETITPEELIQAVKAGNVALIDVRSAREFGEGHIPGAINIPDADFYNDFEGALAKLPTDRRVIFLCATGARSAGAFFSVTDEPDAYKNPHGIQYLNKGVDYSADGSFSIH